MSALPITLGSAVQFMLADVILGPCPGCGLWQVDYTHDVADSYMKRMVKHVVRDNQPWYAVVEMVLADHVRECAPLRDELEDGW